MSTRRTFLQAATATAALAQRAYSANDQVNVACIGYGIMGQGDVDTEASIPGVKITAVSDVYEGRMTLAKERYGKDIFTSRDYREVLARKDVDAVIVATPDHWHSKIAIDAMEAGKDVYCQKPMVQHVGEGAAMVAAEKKTGRIVQVGSQRVSNILYAKARDLVAQGAIGKVRMIEAYWDRNSSQGAWQYTIPPDATPQNISWDQFLGRAPKRPFEPIRLFRWRNYQDYGTGIAGDLFVHLFSGIHFVMNSLGPSRVYTSGGTYFWNDGRDVPDLQMGIFDYPETANHPAFNLSLRVNFEAGGGQGSGFKFIGTEGALNLSVGGALVLEKTPREIEPGNTAGTFAKATREAILAEYRQKYPPQPLNADSMRPLTEQRFVTPRGYTEQKAHHEVFIDAVRTRKPVVENTTFGLRAAAPALLSNVSYFERKLIQWDPERMTVKA
jgi:predicted dehydrogenase